MGRKQQTVDNHDAPNSVNSVSGPKRKDASRRWRGRSSTNVKSDRPAIVCYACAMLVCYACAMLVCYACGSSGQKLSMLGEGQKVF